ncbi:uncharacterized protein LOC133930419 [Phragmites australis]|uniref:uncharacterized protein LOC133930419 n=1 Tax=Phragmites australis TaxID=29695 RepID=UPI002D765CAC|nr:uncharacterized protein LOC133930419 [Phragmites australis]
MATGVQPETTIDPMNSTITPGPGNEEIEDSIGGGGGRQDNMDESSSTCSSVDSTQDDFDLLWGLRKYLVLLGILAVSVTYNSGLTPPGGFWNKKQDGHEAGDPALRVEFYQRYEVFFYCNATAFAASLVLIILLLSKSVARKKLWLRSMQFTMIVDLFSLMGGYAAGSCRALKSSIYIWVLVFAVFVYLWIHILVSTRLVPPTLKKMVNRVVMQILSKLGICDGQTSRRQEKKDLKEARKFILTLVTFAATVTYQAGLSPPGGFWAENEYKQRPATSVLRSHYLHRYNIFVSCNSTSFVASLVTIILLLSPEFSRHGIRSKAVVVCVVADLFCLIGAYAAGCCRDIATSFYVMFIIVIVLICIAFLAGIFVYQPVADWLKKIKSDTVWCMGELGRALSSKFGSSRSSNAGRESYHASHHQASVHEPDAPAENNASEPEHQSPDNQLVSNSREVESCGGHPAAHKQKTANMKEALSNSQHPSENGQQSVRTKDFVFNLEHQSTECQLDANMKEARSSTEHPSLICQETAKTRDDMPADSQHIAGMKEQSSTDDNKNMPAEGFSDQSMLPNDCNDSTNDVIVDEGPSLAVEASGNVNSAEEHTSGGYDNHDIEIGGINNSAEQLQNGHIDSNRGPPDQNAHGNQTEEHLNKTRTYLLLLAILAVSLTYQSGLNPPGGFWSGSDAHHSPGDRILEDISHPRFIAFFYLNAVAFVASIVMILMLLEKNMIMQITKRRELQIAMIVDLLSLTGAFVMGSCREAKKSIYISVLVCLVLSYVAVHVLIAVHVIPPYCEKIVSEKLKNLGHKQTGNITKEFERRCNLLLTLAILAATVTYQAGINPPGGVWSDDKDIGGIPGNPILQDNHRRRYDVFYYSNSVSFVSSVVITILIVNKESCEHGIKSYALRVCLVVGLLGLLIAYAAGSCRNRKQSIFVIIIAVAVLISLVIQVLLSSVHDTLGRPLAQLMECLQQLMEYLQRLVYRTENGREITSESLETSDCEEKLVRKRHKYLMLIATLAASITYQAGLNPPGGFWSDDNGHFAGNPLLHDINRRRYMTFFCFNAISFMASIVVVMLLLSKSVRKKNVPLEVLLLIMILDLLALMIAFAAGSCRKFRTSVYVFVLVAGVVVYLVILFVLSRGIEKCLRKLKRSGLLCSRHPERISKTITPVQGEKV